MRRLAAGKVVLPAPAVSGWVEPLNGGGESGEKATLSARELQILALVALGCRNKEIGPKLGIHGGTVHAHLHRALGKLGVHDKRAAVQELFGSELTRSLHFLPPKRWRLPKTLRAFKRRFASERACRKYLVKVRWPEGFRCPHCQADRGWHTGRRLWRCRQCRRSVSVTANTLFEKTRIPLTVWFRAAWELTGKDRAPTIAEFRIALGLGSYKTAWACLHKLRSCLERIAREPQEKPGSSRFETFNRLLRIAGQTPDRFRRRPGGEI